MHLSDPNSQGSETRTIHLAQYTSLHRILTQLFRWIRRSFIFWTWKERERRRLGLPLWIGIKMTGLVEVSVQSLPLLATFSPSFLLCLTDCERPACQLSVECRLLLGPFPIKHRSKRRHLYRIDFQHSTREKVHTEKISVFLYFLQETPPEFWVRKHQLKLSNCC